jgi:hypothetical protein
LKELEGDAAAEVVDEEDTGRAEEEGLLSLEMKTGTSAILRSTSSILACTSSTVRQR